MTISRPPLRYDQKDHAVEEDGYSPPPALGQGEDADASRSARPGQSGFARRLMSKYGWTKGSGLGADESGIINPLRAQVEKRRKKADADGGGWAEPAGKGKIIGGKRKDNTSKFGSMSEVIVLKGMLENMPDLHAEIADGLGQEIGEECGEKVNKTSPSRLQRKKLTYYSMDESSVCTLMNLRAKFSSNLRIKYQLYV